MFSFFYRLLLDLIEYMSKMLGVLCQAEIKFLFSVVCFVCLLPGSCVAYVDCILDGPILTAPWDYLMFDNYFNKINPF